MNRFCAVALLCVLGCFVCSSDSETPDASVNNILPNPRPRPEQNERVWYLPPFPGSGQGFLRRGERFQVLQMPNLKTGVPTTFYCTERVCLRADQWPNM